MTTIEKLEREKELIDQKIEDTKRVNEILYPFTDFFLLYRNEWIKGNNLRVYISLDNCPERDELSGIIRTLKPTGKHIVNHGSENVEIDNPFRLEIQSNIKSPDIVKIDFESEFGFDVTIHTPIEWYNQVTKSITRKPTSNEHHYFTGMSINQINRQDIPCKEWVYNELSFYGGYKLLKRPTDIDTVMNIVFGM